MLVVLGMKMTKEVVMFLLGRACSLDIYFVSLYSPIFFSVSHQKSNP